MPPFLISTLTILAAFIPHGDQQGAMLSAQEDAPAAIIAPPADLRVDLPADASVEIPVDQSVNQPADLPAVLFALAQDELSDAAITSDNSPPSIGPITAEPAAEAIDLAIAPPVQSPLAFPNLSDEEVMQSALRALEDISTLRSKFTQYSQTGNELSGTLNLRRPGRLRFDYDAPSDQLIVAAGGVVYVHDAALETTDSYPVRKTPLRFLLAKKIDDSAATLDAVYRGEDTITLVLSSADSEEEITGQLALVFGAPDFDLREWIVIEPSGSQTLVTLSEQEYGVKLPGRLFRVPSNGGRFLDN